MNLGRLTFANFSILIAGIRDPSKRNLEWGEIVRSLPIDLNAFIVVVYVSPSEGTQMEESLREALLDFGLGDKEVRHSSLRVYRILQNSSH